MNNEQLEDRLRSTADPLERDYRPRPLPHTVELDGRASPMADRLRVAGAGLAGAATALLAVAVVSAYTGGRDGISFGAPADSAGGSCQTTAFDITVEAWPEAPLAGGVLLTFQAHDGVDCVIDRGLYASVTDASGTALVESAVGVRDPIKVTPGSVWQAGVSWSTYCGTSIDGAAASAARPLQLAVAFGVADEIEGEVATVGGAPAQLDVAAEIAPEPCAEQFPGTPFVLLPTEVSATGPNR